MCSIVPESDAVADTWPRVHNVDIILENYDLYVRAQWSPVTMVQPGVWQMDKRI